MNQGSIYIIILGGPIVDNKPGVWLKSRLDKCIQIYQNSIKKHVQVKFVLSGMGTHAECDKLPESSVMKTYLVQNMLPSNILIEESKSRNTIENAVLTLELMRHYQDIRDIYVITSDFHVPRSKFIFDFIFNGFQNIQIKYVSCVTPISKKEYERLELNEKKLIKQLEKHISDKE